MNSIKVRKLLFWSFVALFIVSAPIVLFYTAGYRYTPGAGIFETGTMLLATTPRDATVTLDGRAIRDKTPSIVKKVRPGEHTVRFDLEGHESWEKTLTVEAGRTTFADTIVLFSQESPRIFIAEDMFEASWSPMREYIAWANHQKGWTEIWISPIRRPASRLVYRGQNDGHTILNWVDEDVLAIGDEPIYVRANGESFDDFKPAIAQYDILESGDTVAVIPMGDKDDERAIARLEPGDYTIEDERNNYVLLKDEGRSRITLLTDRDKDDPLLLLEDATSWQWIGPDTLLFATNHAIELYEASAHERSTITRLSDTISHVQWHPSRPSYIFFATDAQVRAIELNEIGGRQTSTLANLSSVDAFSLDTRGRTLYVVGEDDLDRGLFTRELFER